MDTLNRIRRAIRLIGSPKSTFIQMCDGFSKSMAHLVGGIADSPEFVVHLNKCAAHFANE
jgi:hypothetical protein